VILSLQIYYYVIITTATRVVVVVFCYWLCIYYFNKQELDWIDLNKKYSVKFPLKFWAVKLNVSNILVFNFITSVNIYPSLILKVCLFYYKIIIRLTSEKSEEDFEEDLTK
jgi:hypothetical protein